MPRSRQTPPATGPRAGTGARPVALAGVCLVAVLQAAVLAGLAIAWASDLVRGRSEVPGATVFLVLFALGVAAVLVAGARGLWHGRRWARSPIMTWQLLLGVMAIGWLTAEPAAWAMAVLASALVVAVGLLQPAVVAATSDGVPRPDGGLPTR